MGKVQHYSQRVTDSILPLSDGLDGFTAVKSANVNHMHIVVGEKRKSPSMACFHWINTIIANIKTATKGTYHSFAFEKYGLSLPRGGTVSLQPTLRSFRNIEPLDPQCSRYAKADGEKDEVS